MAKEAALKLKDQESKGSNISLAASKEQKCPTSNTEEGQSNPSGEKAVARVAIQKMDNPMAMAGIAAAAAQVALKKRNTAFNGEIETKASVDSDMSYDTVATVKTTAILSSPPMAGIAAAAAQVAMKKKNKGKNYEDTSKSLASVPNPMSGIAAAAAQAAMKRKHTKSDERIHELEVPVPNAMKGIDVAASQTVMKETSKASTGRSKNTDEEMAKTSHSFASEMETINNSGLEAKDSVDSDISYDTNVTVKTTATLSSNVMAGIAAQAAAQAAIRRRNITKNDENTSAKSIASVKNSSPALGDDDSAKGKDNNEIDDLEIETQDSFDSILNYELSNQHVTVRDDSRIRPSNPLAATITSMDKKENEIVSPPLRPIAKYIDIEPVEPLESGLQTPHASFELLAPSDECNGEQTGLKASNSIDSELSYDTMVTVNTLSTNRPKSGRQTFNSTVLRPLETEKEETLSIIESNHVDGGDKVGPLPNTLTKGHNIAAAAAHAASIRRSKVVKKPDTSKNVPGLDSQESFDSQESLESLSTINTSATSGTLQTIQSFARKTDLAFQTLTKRANIPNHTDRIIDQSGSNTVESNSNELGLSKHVNDTNEMDSRNDEATIPNRADIANLAAQAAAKRLQSKPRQSMSVDPNSA